MYLFDDGDFLMNDFKKQIEMLSAQMQYFKTHKHTLSKADRLAFLGRILALGFEIANDENFKKVKDE